MYMKYTVIYLNSNTYSYAILIHLLWIWNIYSPVNAKYK